MCAQSNHFGSIFHLLSLVVEKKAQRQQPRRQELAGELADILFAVICLANSQGIDLQEAFEQMIAKYNTRDSDRY
ncbi:MazG nucleotide pyrophosphohydrolase domain-containing protein [Nostoc spongiaeforme]|nr:MazG nucleotide pyrophosphohydrolase domain-containing protein [Nostoc spongiaeforme]